MHEREAELVSRLRRELMAMNDVTVFGPEDSAGIVSFAIDDIHPHDLGTILDEANVAIRAGHHCTQPLHRAINAPSTARASLYFYNTTEDIDKFIDALKEAVEFFGSIFG